MTCRTYLDGLYLGMCEEEVFDLGGVDILATPDDHVLDATDDITVAVFIDHRNVTEAPQYISLLKGPPEPICPAALVNPSSSLFREI